MAKTSSASYSGMAHTTFGAWAVGLRMAPKTPTRRLATPFCSLLSVSELRELRTRSKFTERACAKLRSGRQYARSITVFIHTNPFAVHEVGYSNQATGSLTHHTNDSFQFNRLAQRLLEQIWRDGFDYNKGGVMLGDFSRTTLRQVGLFEKPIRDNSKVMEATDKINNTVGSIRLATSSGDQHWAMRRERLSPAYRTRWLDIPRVK